LHPKISIILDLGEHVDVDNDPEKAEDHPHTPDDQPIELEAPVAGGEGGKPELNGQSVLTFLIRWREGRGAIGVGVRVRDHLSLSFFFLLPLFPAISSFTLVSNGKA